MSPLGLGLLLAGALAAGLALRHWTRQAIPRPGRVTPGTSHHGPPYPGDLWRHDPAATLCTDMHQQGYLCTLPRGHDGNHVAEGSLHTVTW